MGLLRVYLALCVIAWHSTRVFPWIGHNGREAVQIFYMISGFYMALILSGGRYASVRNFYLSRFLRIYPPYFLVLAITIVVFIFSGVIFHRWHSLSMWASHPVTRDGVAGTAAAALWNLTLFGQDWSTFLAHDGDGPWRISFARDWFTHTLSHDLIVPQCWSIGVELTYYVCAPFLNRLSTRSLCVIVAVSTVARVMTYHFLRLDYDPWNYRFFPFEISLFIAGMLGYRFYVQFESRVSDRWKVRSGRAYAISGIVLLIVFKALANLGWSLGLLLGSNLGILASYVAWAFVIPALFFVFGHLRTDRAFGELSYPIYLVHELVIAAVTPLMVWSGMADYVGAPVAVISLVIAFVFYRYWIAPTERHRHFLAAARPKTALTRVPVAAGV